MKMRIYCPECRQLLVLRRAAIESTRVKCQSCGAKFYAGKAEQAATPVAAPASAPTPEPIAPSAPHAYPTPLAETKRVAADLVTAVADAPDEVGAKEPGERKKHRKERVRTAKPSGLPSWAIPLGVAVLAATSALGLFVSQKAPDVPQLPATSADLPPVNTANATVIRNPNALVHSLELRRPDALVGVWELQEPGGGTIDFAFDGLVEIQAPLVTADRLTLSSRWHITSHEGSIYEIDIGPELARDGNHRTRVVVVDQQTFRLTKYAVPGKLNVRERIFKRRQ